MPASVVPFSRPPDCLRRLAAARESDHSGYRSAANRGSGRELAGLSVYRRRRGAKEIADGISGDAQNINDEPVLKERMKDALATLKTTSGDKSSYLYDLPWYVIIGPPARGRPLRS